MNEEELFYIGWEDRASNRVRGSMRRFAILWVLTMLGIGALVGLCQRTIGWGVFEWGTIKPFRGVFRASPYPHLIVSDPNAEGAPNARPGSSSSYYLVNPFKFGLDAELCRTFDGQVVELKGTLIYQKDRRMVEVQEGSLKKVEPRTEERRLLRTPGQISLGRQTLRGEIVDSKCYLGVMNPGHYVPHRGCAIRCISGGIPPILLVRSQGQPDRYFLLTSSEGRPVNQQVLEWVAEPVEITGEVEQQGDLIVLKADPSTFRRIE